MVRTATKVFLGLALSLALCFAAAGIGMPQVKPGKNPPDPPPPPIPNPCAAGPNPCDVGVFGVQERSPCDIPEWWVQATNRSADKYYRVSIHARVLASAGEPSACTVEDELTLDLAPGTCNFLTLPMPMGRGCDLINCVPPDTCTTILNAHVSIVAWRSGGNDWCDVADPPMLCVMENGAVTESGCGGCQLIKGCAIPGFAFNQSNPCATNGETE